MADGTSGVFGLPPGADFPALFVQGFLNRHGRLAPEQMARVRIFVNAPRMRRRISALLAARGPGVLPRLHLVTDLDRILPLPGLPDAAPALRRQLALSRLIARLLDAEPDVAPRSAIFDLAESLARLADEMHGEGVAPDRIAALPVGDHSAHWARMQRFLSILAPMFAAPDEGSGALRTRLAAEALVQGWQARPPTDPVIVAGSTGSRGTTLHLMQAVARLPQGAVVLPGFDFGQPAGVWDRLDDALTAEDHPQYRFRHLCDRLGIHPTAVETWVQGCAPPDPARNRVISLSLRPAPVTDQWLAEGRRIADLAGAMRGVSLVEAPGPRAEALAIALILRRAAEDGRSAALVTPDRTLSRQVTAALDRWGIRPDDSAGRPLALSPPGRFLRQIARILSRPLTADALLALLKHPLCFSGGDRGNHLRMTRDLELRLRRHGPAFPAPEDLRLWAAARNEADCLPWALALAAALSAPAEGDAPLADHVARHTALAEALSRGTAPDGSGTLWDQAAGEASLALMRDLALEAAHGAAMSASEYADLFDGLIQRREVRDPVQAHPAIRIWGTLEARVQGADLVVLGGLNEGIWPAAPAPDPWLNRQMRKAAGLLLPERQVGLSAHDFQQAIGAPEVVMTRAQRDGEAETIPSRWLNRLTNLLAGLPDQGGAAALADMRDRGQVWLRLAAALDTPGPGHLADPGLRPAPRPAPCPPLSARPNRLSLTRVATLIRDPYAIYARYVLGLKPLDALHPVAEARDRGTLFHRILERFVREAPEGEVPAAGRARLLSIAAEVLGAEVPFPSVRALWLARMARAADHFLQESARFGGTPERLETEGTLVVSPPGFTLFGTPDRIDRLADGTLHLIDYKSGTPPSEAQQAAFDKQLLLAACMAERGGFAEIGPETVSRITYIGLGGQLDSISTERAKMALEDQWQKFCDLIARYHRPDTGYIARRAVFEAARLGDYDHLARFGEWQMTDGSTPLPVGGKAPE